MLEQREGRYLFFMRHLPGVFSTFFCGGGGGGNMGRAVFQGRVPMITNNFFLYGLTDFFLQYAPSFWQCLFIVSFFQYYYPGISQLFILAY